MGAAKRAGIVALVAALALALVVGVVWVRVRPHRGQATYAQTTLPLDHVLDRDDAVADLDHVAQTIRDRHVWAASGLPQAFEDSWRGEVAALPADPTVVDVWRGTQRMLVTLGDGHTFSAASTPGQEHYDADFRVDDGGLWVASGATMLQVHRVNGVDVHELVRRNRDLTPADNEGWVEQQLEERLRSSSHLALLGAPAPSGGYTVDVIDHAGEAATLAVQPGEAPPEQGPSADYGIDEDLAVLTIHRCVVDEDYTAALEGFFTEVDARALQRIVVDVRDNAGGSSLVTDRFVEYLDVGTIPTGSTRGRYGPWVLPLGSGSMSGRAHPTAYSGDIVVLTSRATFSSAADFATVLSDNHLATIVGEPPGSAPTGAGDIVVFQLPNSGLFMQVSYKEFVRPDPTRARSTLEVDVAADPGGTVEEMLR